MSAFKTVEQMRAEFEELKNRLSVLDEFRVSSQNTLIAANEAHVGEMRAEIERLREAIGTTRTRLIILRMQVNSGYDFNENLASIDVLLNETRAALQPKEGK
jgi:uncharacterized coiled-coil protein SlyX